MHSGAIRRILKNKKKMNKKLMMLEEKILKWQNIEMNVAISQKKSWVSMHCWNLLIINDSKRKWTKILRTDSVQQVKIYWNQIITSFDNDGEKSECIYVKLTKKGKLSKQQNLARIVQQLLGNKKAYYCVTFLPQS